MSYSCPLNFEQVDSNVSRLSSLLVAMLIVIYLLTSIEYILYFLILDFSLKLFVKRKYSFITICSTILCKSLKMEVKFTDGGAKKLASIFAFIFVSLLLIMNFLELPTFTYLIASIFLLCSLLDVVINYCLGCRIYYVIKKMYPSFMS